MSLLFFSKHANWPQKMKYILIHMQTESLSFYILTKEGA